MITIILVTWYFEEMHQQCHQLHAWPPREEPVSPGCSDITGELSEALNPQLYCSPMRHSEPLGVRPGICIFACSGIANLETRTCRQILKL